MRVGIIGTGAIANLHARVYSKLGFPIRVCWDIREDVGERFAAEHGAEFVRGYETVCRHPEVDFVDVCTFPDFRLDPVRAAAGAGKSIQVQKPIAVSPAIAREMIAIARAANVTLGVVSQHRFDDASAFVHKAVRTGRLGRLLECDAYVKWYRSAEYYARPIKGSWQGEGGGALINQGIHQIDLLRWIVGPVREVSAMWQLGALHRIESEDIVNALLAFANGATGVVQAATAFAPGYTERVEIHGSKGTAVISGDKLTTWDVKDDEGDPPPLAAEVASGASDPMAISLEPFERQFRNFTDAVRTGSRPLIAGEDGLQALELVDAIYQSCRTGGKVRPPAD